jgi:hypothetical protein
MHIAPFKCRNPVSNVSENCIVIPLLCSQKSQEVGILDERVHLGIREILDAIDRVVLDAIEILFDGAGPKLAVVAITLVFLDLFRDTDLLVVFLQVSEPELGRLYQVQGCVWEDYHSFFVAVKKSAFCKI